MNETDLQAWVTAQRARVEDYLRAQSLANSQVAEWPAFDVAPHFGIWAVESASEPNAIGWWVFSGDIPSDYISGRGIPDPRAALGAIIRAWNDYIPFLDRGEQPPNTRLGRGSNCQSWPHCSDYESDCWTSGIGTTKFGLTWGFRLHGETRRHCA